MPALKTVIAVVTALVLIERTGRFIGILPIPLAPNQGRYESGCEALSKATAIIRGLPRTESSQLIAQAITLIEMDESVRKKVDEQFSNFSPTLRSQIKRWQTECQQLLDNTKSTEISLNLNALLQYRTDMRNRMETVSVSREDDKEVAKLEVEVKENLAMLSHMTMDHMSHQ